MAIFRIEKTKNYTVMSNYHLQDTNLSLKAKGLLSLMLSLPDDWDYTTKGLAQICKDGVDSICAGVRELEAQGYVSRRRVRNENGQLGSIEYTVVECPEALKNNDFQPKQENPVQAALTPNSPKRENPVQVNLSEELPKRENPVLENPILENPVQQNTNIPNTNILNNYIISNPILSNPNDNTGKGIGLDKTKEREVYQDLVYENIDYDILVQEPRIDQGMLNEIAELIVDIVCSSKKTIRISGDHYPTETVKSRFMRLDSSHIEYVIDCMKNNTTYVRNIKQYLLAALYNAPVTINSYYSSLVSHDLHSLGQKQSE